jgi:hypothetical protein
LVVVPAGFVAVPAGFVVVPVVPGVPVVEPVVPVPGLVNGAPVCGLTKLSCPDLASRLSIIDRPVRGSVKIGCPVRESVCTLLIARPVSVSRKTSWPAALDDPVMRRPVFGSIMVKLRAPVRGSTVILTG